MTACRAAARVLVLLAVVGTLPACSKPAAPKEADAAAPAAATADALADAPADAAAPDAPVPIVIEAKPSSIVIDNRLGRRLISVRISIEVAETASPFILVVPTIEKDTKEEFEFTRFLSEDATMLDPSTMHPKQVNIKTHDSFGRPHEMTVPWAP